MRDYMVLSLLGLSLTGCESTTAPSCKVICASDSDCPSDQSCGELGLCTAGEACGCQAGDFFSCEADTAVFCNDAANGLRMEDCAAGCNGDAGRCNVCVPDSLACSADNSALEQCGSDGLPGAASETCALDCVAGDGAVAPHCGYIQPLYLPDICDAPATGPELLYEVPINLSTTSDTSCTEVLTQTAGPEICVIRAPRITFNSTVTVKGNRLLAFVADTDILMQGTLDVSADGAMSGPGGGVALSGAAAAYGSGGGGAGFKVNGAAGGNASGAGLGGAGGGVLDPLAPPRFIGGPRPQPQSEIGFPAPGGGGGGLTLIACRGEVSVSGTIDANGGGGRGGRDVEVISVGVTSVVAAAGGGAGGYVVLQGAKVSTNGAIYANGGAGGGGCSTDNCTGSVGADGQRSSTPAMGGPAMGGGGSGGAGGVNATPPVVGSGSTSSPGGGGGSSGHLQACVPVGGQATIAGTNIPNFRTTATILTR